MDIEYFMKIQNAYGTHNKRERELAKVNYEMAKHFEDTFDTADVLVNNRPMKLMIIKDTDGNTFKKKIKSRHEDKFNLGDYVIWNEQVWLITLVDSDEKTWNRGYMYLCTLLLRFQNIYGKIIERWCYAEDFTKYSSGIVGNTTIATGDYQYGITIPVDEETKYLKRNKRFPIDIEGVMPPDIYKLTNRKIYLSDNRYFRRGGVMVLTLSYSEFNANTDKLVTLDNGTQAWICDYFDPKNQSPVKPEPSEPDKSNILCNINGRTTINIGSPRTYTVTFTNAEGKDIPYTDIDYKWNIKANFNDQVEQQTAGNSLTLRIDNNELIYETFSLQVTVNDVVVSEVQITIEDIY